ncbi:beta-defensin 136 [Nannospalax galili]|uniref:Defensin beta 42 n=1 Tax=Nannospalax galili TaxID=1026970 RepID=A0A8C6RKG2_NANGA|nr:beta-defensin 136 [Nannospalax galili]
MSLSLSGLLFFLMTSLPSGNCTFGNRGVDLRTCNAIEGVCFFGCKPGWTWIAFCNNLMSCCRREKTLIPPQANVI